ncbi:sialin-like [Dermacentor albipictus]|uniref:sialin-like n=1 Tax=Dermacentor albipictus TaxID=60249 RepID=UPI0038FC83D5
MEARTLATLASKQRKTCRLQVRYLMSCMISIGLFLVYSMRVNLSVTIIAMVNATAVNGNTSSASNVSCPVLYRNASYIDGGDESGDGEFLWDPVMQGYVLNAFFYGYIITQIPAGWLSEVINPAWILAAGVGITSLLTLATAVVARASFGAFLGLRVLEGIAEGVTFPSTFAIMARWSPVQERSFLLAVSTLGSILGTAVTLPISAVLCQYGFAGGWPSVFYLTGLLGCVWFVFWVLIASDRPEKHRFISQEEKKHIVESRGATFSVHKSVPWASILTSRAVWMCALIKFCGAWSFYTLLTELPSYLADVLHFNIQSDGSLNASVYLSQVLVGLGSSYLADHLRRKEILGVTNVRKVFESIGLLGQAIGLVGVAFAGCDWKLAFAMLLVASTSGGALCGSESVLPVDVAAEFAGAVMGLVNCVSNTAGIFTPLVVGYLTESSETTEQWNKVFFTSAGVVTFGAVAFLLFGKAEVEPWARQPCSSINDSCSLLVPADEAAGDSDSVSKTAETT